MCHYITIAIPAESSQHRLRQVLRAHGKTYSSLGDDVGARKMFDTDVHYGLTTREHCDCGTVVGSLANEDPESDPEDLKRRIDRRIRKLKRKGWSASRIDDWVRAEQIAAEIASKRAGESSVADAEQWVRMMLELVDVSADGRAWLLLHWYSGRIDREGIKPRRRESVSREKLTTECIMKIEEDVLYEFRER